MKVALTLEEREFVKQAADNCTDANTSRHDIADYDHRRFNLTSRQANRLGKFAEAAAFKYLGGKVLDHTLEEWAHFVPNDHPDYHRLVKVNHDLWNAVEVRRANALGNPIPVRAKDRKPGVVVVQVHVPYRQALGTPDNPYPPIIVGLNADITGWCWADDEGTRPAWAKSDTLVVPHRPITDFPWEVLSHVA